MSERTEPSLPDSPSEQRAEGSPRHDGVGFSSHGSVNLQEEGNTADLVEGTRRSEEGRNYRETDTQETWDSFLRQVSPQEIARRELYDPVRREYVHARHREVAEEARRRRRAVTLAGRYGGGNDYNSPTTRDTGRRRPTSLQIHERPLPRPPSSGRELHTVPSEYVVPRWQPDYEAWSCPICGREFNLFFRRHHCRKCGRVVCANCSPHRITIPRQFIVHPPSEGEESVPRMTRTDAVDLAFQDSDARQDADIALGDGEEVRLCNPCVPDPNPLPPPSYISSDGQRFVDHPRTDSIPFGDRSRNRISMPPQPSRRYHNEQDAFHSNGRGHSHRWSTGPNSAVPRIEPAQGSPTEAGRYWTVFGSAPTSSRFSNWPPATWAPSISDPHGPLPPTPPPPPPPIREEDECPVCHRELPPKGPDGSEAAREAHVVQCIQSHFSSSGPRSVPNPPAATAIAAAVSASAATPADAGGSPSSPDAAVVAASPRRRAPGMLVYHASEKDCIAEDGSQQECVICFEEFAVGDEMGRLECLCKFHRICIRQWWDTKGVGACPVHQDGI